MEKTTVEICYALAIAETYVYRAMKELDTNLQSHAQLWHDLNRIDNLLLRFRSDLSNE